MLIRKDCGMKGHDGMKKRNEIIQLYVSAEEKKVVKQRASKLGIESVSAYVRWLILRDNDMTDGDLIDWAKAYVAKQQERMGCR
jgi:hypothetical protein